MPPAVQRPQKITLAEMRSSGVRGVLVYCADVADPSGGLAVPFSWLSRSAKMLPHLFGRGANKCAMLRHSA
jgi:hypothetical protein